MKRTLLARAKAVSGGVVLVAGLVIRAWADKAIDLNEAENIWTAIVVVATTVFTVHQVPNT